MLAVEKAQRVRVQPALRVGIERVGMPLEVLDQCLAMRAALVGIADRIDRERDTVEPERTPEPRQHDDLLGVDIRAREAERLDVELMELPIATLLRALVPEHRTAGPCAQRPLVEDAVLDRRAHDAGRRFRPQRQALAVQLVLERVHLVLDDVGVRADAAHE